MRFRHVELDFSLRHFEKELLAESAVGNSFWPSEKWLSHKSTNEAYFKNFFCDIHIVEQILHYLE